MKIKKGIFKVAYEEGWLEYEGSYGLSFPLYIHRREKEKLWNVSHFATGYAIKKKLSLAQARALVKAIKRYPLFLTPTIDTFKLQLEVMKTKTPLQYSELMYHLETWRSK
jgi:hypothetical protein